MVNGKRQIVLVVHNVRSALNVGSILRTAEGLGVKNVFLTGYTPYPEAPGDSRLPHVRRQQTAQIHKTALGAESYLNWTYEADINKCLDELEREDYLLAALEQTSQAMRLDEFNGPEKIAIIVGNEVAGLEKDTLGRVKRHLQIPMAGHKESFNVAVAAAIATYHLLSN